MRELIIDGKVINDASDCWVIAEIGHNHQGSVEQCKELFRQAKAAGADAVKLQKRDNRSLYTKAYYERPYDSENAFGPTYGLHREALEFGEAEYRELQAYAKELEITFFSTAFDIPSADVLEKLDVPVYKIASGDARSTPLLKYVAQFGKPMIVSTGGATMDDVQRIVDTVLPINSRLAILQCTASYPAAFDILDLRVIDTFRQQYPEVTIGFSGHDNGIAMAVVAYVLGSRIVEKHFTLNRAMKGTDHAFSLEPTGLRKMVRDLRRTRVALGDGAKKVHPIEKPAVEKMGKKLVAARELPAGHVLTAADVAMKSPGNGLQPFELDNVLGRALTVPLAEDGDIVLAQLAPVGTPAERVNGVVAAV